MVYKHDWDVILNGIGNAQSLVDEDLFIFQICQRAPVLRTDKDL